MTDTMIETEYNPETTLFYFTEELKKMDEAEKIIPGLESIEIVEIDYYDCQRIAWYDDYAIAKFNINRNDEMRELTFGFVAKSDPLDIGEITKVDCAFICQQPWEIYKNPKSLFGRKNYDKFEMNFTEIMKRVSNAVDEIFAGNKPEFETTDVENIRGDCEDMPHLISRRLANDGIGKRLNEFLPDDMDVVSVEMDWPSEITYVISYEVKHQGNQYRFNIGFDMYGGGSIYIDDWWKDNDACFSFWEKEDTIDHDGTGKKYIPIFKQPFFMSNEEISSEKWKPIGKAVASKIVELAEEKSNG